MSSKTEIEDSVTKAMPIAFGLVHWVDDASFRQKYQALVTAAGATTGPFLGSETVRYQSMLLLSSLFLISLNVFRFGEITLFDKVVAVDNNLRWLYSAFIAAVAAVFLVKAYVDMQRHVFVREVSAQAVADLRAAFQLGLLKRRVQSYFWFETWDVIGRAYGAYHDLQHKALGEHTSFTYEATNLLTLDDRMRDVPELAAEISAQERALAELRLNLADDERSFKAAAEPIAAAGEKARQDPDPFKRLMNNAYREIEEAFHQHLKPWFDARDALMDRLLDAQAEQMANSAERRKLEAMVAALKRVRGIRRVYVGLEIVMPVSLALAAVVYCLT
jgi:hypothetical protein